MRLFGMISGSLILFVAATASSRAQEEGAGDLKEAVKEVQGAIGKGDEAALKVALASAEGLRESLDDKKLQPLVAALGKGTTHRSNGIALACIEMLGKLKVQGSSKQLGKLFAPPAKVAADKRAIHVAAIKAAGEIHDAAALKALEKLLAHKDAEMAAAGAAALSGYRTLEAKPKLALVKRLVKTLEKLEKTIANAKKDEERDHAGKVRDALVESLQAITGREGLSTAEEWSGYLKETTSSRE